MSTSQELNTIPNTASSEQIARLEKALRRSELLTYAAAGLGIVLLAVIILISLL
ncbi:MAG TPA: hypothetical protein VLV84_00430 [Candidatus Acidoferrales bacterium]|nr:hypothetical protein [Candidatus Acidoferrales bacterium]